LARRYDDMSTVGRPAQLSMLFKRGGCKCIYARRTSRRIWSCDTWTGLRHKADTDSWSRRCRLHNRCRGHTSSAARCTGRCHRQTTWEGRCDQRSSERPRPIYQSQSHFRVHFLLTDYITYRVAQKTKPLSNYKKIAVW